MWADHSGNLAVAESQRRCLADNENLVDIEGGVS
jgi:hypothetical protein